MTPEDKGSTFHQNASFWLPAYAMWQFKQTEPSAIAANTSQLTFSSLLHSARLEVLMMSTMKVTVFCEVSFLSTKVHFSQTTWCHTQKVNRLYSNNQTMAQVEGWVWSHANPCRICSGRSIRKTDFPPLLWHYRPTWALASSILHLQASLSSADCLPFLHFNTLLPSLSTAPNHLPLDFPTGLLLLM